MLPTLRPGGWPTARRGLLRTLATAAAAFGATTALVGLLPARAQAAAPTGPAVPPAASPTPPAAAPALRWALVAQDGSALRAAPQAGAAVLAPLAQGDLVELRAERPDFWQVWDHRRERAGYVRASQLRPLGLAAADAPALLAVLRFLRDAPGQEALAIAYAAAYLQAVPAGQATPEPWDALGTLAERLARRASAGANPATAGGNGPASGALDAVAAYGLRFNSLQREDALTLCYDGEAFRQVLAMTAGASSAALAEPRARAVLALTRSDCPPPALGPAQRPAWDLARAALLDSLGAATEAQLPVLWRQRLHLRRAAVWAALAHQRQREALGQPVPGIAPPAGAGDARQAAQRALDALASVQRSELAEDDQAEAHEAVLRVAAVRWAGEPLPVTAVTTASVSARPALAAPRLALRTEPGEPGQTCVLLVDAAQAATAVPLARRCSFGAVWPTSANAAPDGRALAVAVSPLPGWTELWLFKAGAAGQPATVDVLPPAVATPDAGYAELAGWVPGAAPRLLLVREARCAGMARRSFELVSLDSLATEKQASQPTLLALWGPHAQAGWRRGTLSLR